MKKINFNKVKGFFPLTIQNADVIDSIPIQPTNKTLGIKAFNYQSDDVNQQQFHKPISKILQF